MASYVEIIRLFLSSQTLDFRKNTPAYAGNTSDPSSTIPVFRDHPRLRGEYGRLPVPLIVPVGSPPLARGIQSVMLEPSPPRRITPACAGNTKRSMVELLFCMGSPPLARGIPPCFPQRAPWSGDHPRLRGEYSKKPTAQTSGLGSPPLARGILKILIAVFLTIGITPACAGNTTVVIFCKVYIRDHPRLRGEYCGIIKHIPLSLGSPPLARGIHIHSTRNFPTPGITPACAGNTLKKSLIYNLFPISISKFHLVSQTPEML